MRHRYSLNLKTGQLEWGPDTPSYLETLKNLPWDRPSGSIQLGRDDFKDFPYLMGDWDGTGWNQV